MATWKDLKLAVLQKMFSSNGTTIVQDSSTSEYLYSMPQAANEGLQMLATAGKFIIKSIQIVNRPISNLLSNSFENNSVDGSISFTAEAAKSYYCKIQGIGTLTISVDGEAVSTISVDSYSGYTTFKGLISNENDAEVEISFTTDYPANMANVALYGYTFPTDDDVPDYEEYIRYNLKELADDFYQLAEAETYREKDSEVTYEAVSNYYQEGTCTLVIPREEEGLYTVYYKAYPEEITLSTEDSYELELDPEVYALLPLYMASQLYKDDDNSIATTYRNEFEVAFERLSQKSRVPRKESFTSESGWC